jgi:ATP-dependent DNA helicase RecG
MAASAGAKARADKVAAAPRAKAVPVRSRRARADDVSEGDLAGLPVSTLPGVGPATAARLSAHGLGTIGELLAAVPRDYDDLRTFTPLGALPAKQEGAVVLVRGTITRVSSLPGRFLAVTLEAGGARVIARWFRVPGGMARAYEKGREVALAGPLRFVEGAAAPELLHPANVTASLAGVVGAGAAAAASDEGGVLATSQNSGLGIRSRYAPVPGVAGRALERIVAAAVDAHADRLPDVLAAATRGRLGLPAVGEALRTIHCPERTASAALLDALVAGQSDAHRRLALEDLLVVQVGLARRKVAARSQPGRTCAVALDQVVEKLRAALPFPLTRAQARVVAEVHGDLSTSRPMQRLLVGDVGSGKTAVAFAAAVQVAMAGGQTLLMTPTEILAEQHARTLGRFAEPLGLRVGLLTASTPRPQRETLLALARAGRVAMLVGTQSLLADRVALPDLRLAIVDEQHRFGVAERARLRQRDDADTGTLPHMLVMTATPIPRTLAFTLYGDLDLSVLDELPPGRQAVSTRVLVGEAGRRLAEEAISAVVAAGRRVFVVCPVRESSKRAGAVTAVDRHRELAGMLAPARVGLVHGDLDARAKESTLRAFRAGTLDVLVATTVIEVGIDVPEAALMVVEEADRFGLAQLHQLRGRVGRGNEAADCLLLCSAGQAGADDAGDPRARAAARARLDVLASTTDGFVIAEADLHQRGCGDLFGARQAGMPRLRFADLAGTGRMLELARAEAARILAIDAELLGAEHQPLRRAVDARWAAAQIFGEEAG